MSSINPKDINIDNLTIPSLEDSQRQPGFRSCKPMYNDKNLFILTHEVYLPFGLSAPRPEKNVKKWSLPISEKTNGVITDRNKTFFSKHEELDQYLLNYVMTNAKEFFGHETLKSKDFYEGNQNLTPKVDSEHPEKTEKYGRNISPTITTDDTTGKFINFEAMVINPEWQPKTIYNHATKKHEPNPKYDASIPRYLSIDPMTIVPKSMGYVTYQLQTVYSVNKKAFGYTWVARSVVITRFGSEPVPLPDLDIYDDEQPGLDEALANMDMPKRQREEEEEAPVPVIEEEEEEQPQKKSKTEKIPKTKGKKNE